MRDLERLIEELAAISAPGRRSGWDKKAVDLIIKHFHGNVDVFVAHHLRVLRQLDHTLRKPE